jgi:hypothetical protein
MMGLYCIVLYFTQFISLVNVLNELITDVCEGGPVFNVYLCPVLIILVFLMICLQHVACSVDTLETHIDIECLPTVRTDF